MKCSNNGRGPPACCVPSGKMTVATVVSGSLLYRVETRGWNRKEMGGKQLNRLTPALVLRDFVVWLHHISVEQSL